MEISQLYAIIEECKKRISRISTEMEKRESERSQAKQIKSKIRERRIQLLRMRYQIKESVQDKKEKQRIVRLSHETEMEIKNNLSIIEKQQIQFDQLLELAQSMKSKIVYVDKKIARVQKQDERNHKLEAQAQQTLRLEKRYWQLRKELQIIKRQKMHQEQSYLDVFCEKNQRVTVINKKIQSVNEEYTSYSQKINIQSEIIDRIYSLESKNSTYLKKQRDYSKINILNKTEQQIMQKRSQDFDVIQKFEIANIMVNKQYERELQQRFIGRIVQQQSRSHDLGKIVNNSKRFSFNFTDIKKVKHDLSQTKQRPMVSELNRGNKSQREIKLEQNKRIRTNQTEIKKYTSQYKNVFQNQQQNYNYGIQPLPQRNILDIYQEIKAKPHLLGQGKGNIQIFKLMKFKNKRKSLFPQKGVALECDK